MILYPAPHASVRRCSSRWLPAQPLLLGGSTSGMRMPAWNEASWMAASSSASSSSRDDAAGLSGVRSPRPSSLERRACSTARSLIAPALFDRRSTAGWRFSSIDIDLGLVATFSAPERGAGSERSVKRRGALWVDKASSPCISTSVEASSSARPPPPRLCRAWRFRCTRAPPDLEQGRLRCSQLELRRGRQPPSCSRHCRAAACESYRHGCRHGWGLASQPVLHDLVVQAARRRQRSRRRGPRRGQSCRCGCRRG